MDTVADLQWAAPWRYDARDRATRPELCPQFIPPPPTGWQDWDGEDEVTPYPVAVTVSGPYPVASRPPHATNALPAKYGSR